MHPVIFLSVIQRLLTILLWVYRDTGTRDGSFCLLHCGTPGRRTAIALVCYWLEAFIKKLEPIYLVINNVTVIILNIRRFMIDLKEEKCFPLRLPACVELL